jgi:hypothetical protein
MTALLGFPPDWTVADARRVILDPSTPHYVAQRAREWVHAREQELAARQDPEPTVARRGVNLTDVVALAVACGVVDPDELVREAKARAPGLEAGYPVLHPEPPEAPPNVSRGRR